MRTFSSRNVARLAIVSTSVFTFSLAFALPAAAATYHIRTDGGTAAQCTGLSNAAYPGSGTGRACAWSGPLVALPPGGSARFAGGDTLLIHTGSYMVGYGAPGADSCSTSWPWDCVPAPIPSGTAAKPTKVVGEGYNGACAAPPELWGTERVSHVLSLAGTSHAVVSCLEITDRSDCVIAHTGGLACTRGDDFPYGQYADNGLYAADSANVKLSKLNIHGLAHYGIFAARLQDWAVDNVTLRANGWAGWDGDFGGGASSNAGTMAFTNFLVEYNGCGENANGQPIGCWSQSAGGYGDGFGTGSTGGNWIFEDATFRYNTSDGLDLLYHNQGGSVTLNRVRTAGNAGNPIKVRGSASITNGVIHANCGYFSGKAFTYAVDHCRAGGDAIAFTGETSADRMSMVNTTIVAESNVMVLASGPTGSRLKLRNNIFVPLPYFLDPSRPAGDTYIDSSAPFIVVDESHAVKQTNPLAPLMNCSTPSVICANDAGLKAATAAKLDPHLKAASPARNSALNNAAEPLVPTIDYFKKPRGLDGFYDRGASEEELVGTQGQRNLN